MILESLKDLLAVQIQSMQCGNGQYADEMRPEQRLGLLRGASYLFVLTLHAFLRLAYQSEIELLGLKEKQ